MISRRRKRSVSRSGRRSCRAFREPAASKVEQIGGLPTLDRPDRNALARYGLSQDAVQQVVVTAVAGTEVGNPTAIGASTSWYACPRP